MLGRGNLFSQEFSIDDSSETIFPKESSPKRKANNELEFPYYLYPVSLKVLNDLRRITRSYAKNLRGLLNIPNLPRRQARRREFPYIEDPMLVGDFEDRVDLTLQ